RLELGTCGRGLRPPFSPGETGRQRRGGAEPDAGRLPIRCRTGRERTRVAVHGERDQRRPALWRLELTSVREGCLSRLRGRRPNGGGKPGAGWDQGRRLILVHHRRRRAGDDSTAIAAGGSTG